MLTAFFNYSSLLEIIFSSAHLCSGNSRGRCWGHRCYDIGWVTLLREVLGLKFFSKCGLQTTCVRILWGA